VWRQIHVPWRLPVGACNEHLGGDVTEQLFQDGLQILVTVCLEDPVGSIDGELLPVHLCSLIAGVEEADIAVELGECPQFLDELGIRGLSWAKRRQAEHQGGDRHDDSKVPRPH
jgi:hypothetical protein